VIPDTVGVPLPDLPVQLRQDAARIRRAVLTRLMARAEGRGSPRDNPEHEFESLSKYNGGVGVTEGATQNEARECEVDDEALPPPACDERLPTRWRSKPSFAQN